MHWLFLALAIVSEVFGSSMLKMSNGFTKLWPTIGMGLGFALSFYALSLALRAIPLGMAYAIWAGVGLVLTCLVSVVFFGQKVDAPGIVGIGLILAGVLVLNTLSRMNGH
ncbi:DMT family transporter [Neisseria canis]|uniref:Putative small multidrug resistance protein n=2 Tax=Neisseria canis TaxID=493 RepID=A0A1X3CYX9_9NEIS|nr:multidrug efflux SMR transporter [Neisseria canis]OSI12644.1 QacE family quaternary ammonium compound efflux SMR transporter [Neisseria canis]VEF02739.1 putative small multidrug resistance protein [Neisseria canis]